MKTLRIILTFLISSHVSVIADEDALPSDSADLIGKLELFESQEIAKAKKAVDEKKVAVAKVLRTHLDRETRAGNLDAALALKDKISFLSSDTAKSEAVAPISTNKDVSNTAENFFIGGVWAADPNATSTYQFNADGTGEKIFKGSRFSLKWTISDDLIKIEVGNQRPNFIVDFKKKELWYGTEGGGKQFQLNPVK